MRQQAALTEVWFIVSPHNPFKIKNGLIDPQFRLKMVKVAIEDNKYFKASNIEFKLPLPSYTAATLIELNKKFPRKKFSVIIGSDTLSNFHRWRNYDTILNNYRLFIYRRGEADVASWRKYPGITFFDAPHIEISSTLIRDMIVNKKSIRYLVPEAISKYIRKNKLYSSK